MTEGILDALLMILVLAVVTALSFTLIVPLTNNDIMSYNEVLQDKALVTDVRDSAVVDPSAIPKKVLYDARGVLLSIHVQDENMPQPRAMRVENNPIEEVQSTYKIEVMNLGRKLWGQLPSLSHLYDINYDYRNGGSYRIERVY